MVFVTHEDGFLSVTKVYWGHMGISQYRELIHSVKKMELCPFMKRVTCHAEEHSGLGEQFPS